MISSNDVVCMHRVAERPSVDAAHVMLIHHNLSPPLQVLIAMAKVIKQPTICERLFEATKFEYKTRHLIDGRIVQCDQRISIVAGYMADEVSGLYVHLKPVFCSHFYVNFV